MAPFSFGFPSGLSDDTQIDLIAPSFVQRSPQDYAQMRGVMSGYPQSTPSAPPSAPMSTPTDPSSMLNQMIAPYRDIAARMDSPYAMFGPGNGFATAHPANMGHSGMTMTMGDNMARMDSPYANMGHSGMTMYSPYAMFGPGNGFATAHPRMAGGIDNAFLALANMGPSGMTVGDNLSGVARGLVGANQWHRQNALQAMMMPYEMAAPRLKMMDEIAQMQQRSAMTQAELSRIPYEQAMEKRANAQSDWYMRRLNEPNEANIHLQLALRKNGVEDISKATPDQITAIQKDLDSMRFRQTMGGGGDRLLGALIYGANPPADPSKGYTPDEYKSLLGIYGQVQANNAAARTGAEQGAAHPFSKGQDLITAARTAAEHEFPKPTGPEFGLGWDIEGMAAFQKFASARQKWQSDVINRNADIQQWIARGGPQKGIAYDVYARDRSVLGGSNGSSSAPTAPSATKSSNSGPTNPYR